MLVMCSKAAAYSIVSIRHIDFFFFFFLLFRAACVAYGSSQDGGQVGAVAAGLCHSHSNARSELHLQSALQLTETPDPHGYQLGS